jgi:glycosyltransferase involved in cell wall biosynthesis
MVGRSMPRVSANQAPASVLQILTDTDRRGSQQFGADLHDFLIKHGRSVRTISLQPGADPDALPFPVFGSAWRSRATLTAVRRAASRSRVVVAHGSFTLPATVLAMLGLKVPLIYRNIGDPLYWSATQWRRLRTSLLLRRIDVIVAVWEGSARSLHDRFGVPADRIRLIPRGVPAARFPVIAEGERHEVRETLGLGPDTAVALYLGALSAEKNVEAAIAAAAAVSDLVLLIAGSGPDRAALEAQAARVAPGRVRFLGPVSDSARVLAATDVLVLPSHTEGIPGVLIEAGLRGLPVVATDVGGVGEVIIDGQTGVLVTPGDVTGIAEGIRKALVSGDAFGRAGRERCLSRYEINSIARAWDELLAETGAWEA